MAEESTELEQRLQEIEDGRMYYRDVAPIRPRDGLYLADGTNWDPGSGVGLYRFSEAADTFTFIG